MDELAWSCDWRSTSLFEAAPDAILVVGAEGELVDFNREALAIFGYSDQEMQTLQVEDLMPMRFRAAHMRHRGLYSQQPRRLLMGQRGKLVGLRKNGEEFPVEIKISPVPGPGTLTMAIARDVSAQQRLEHELRFSLRVLDAISTVQTDYMTRRDGREMFSRLLHAYLDLTHSTQGFICEVTADATVEHLTPLAVSGSSTHAGDTPLAVDDARWDYPAALIRETLQTGARITRHDGAESEAAPAEATGFGSFACIPLYDGIEMVGLVGLMNGLHGYSDEFLTALEPLISASALLVTRSRERQRLEASRATIRQGERMLRAIFDGSRHLMGLLSPNGTIIKINRAGLEFGGLGADDVIDRPFWDTQWWDHAPAVQAELKAAIGRAAAGEPVECRLDARNARGELRTIEFTLEPIMDDAGKVRYIIPEGFDVTKRQRTEAKLEAANQDCDRRVQLRTALLEQANSKLEAERQRAEAASRAKSEFLANMSHELRTPLNAILGYSDILLEEAEDMGEEHLSDVRKIARAGRHLLAMINDILDLAKIEAGKMEVLREQLSLTTFVEDLANMVQPLMGANNNAFHSFCEEGVGEINTDPVKLRQIVLNLLSNAAKFTSGGEVELAVRKVTAGEEQKVEFTVADTGIGMNPDQIAGIFDVFSQAEATTTKKYGGTGLGLAISRRFCEMLGGDISVSSTAGEGTRFVLQLPMVDATATAKPPQGQAGRKVAARGPVRPSAMPVVLAIDDDPRALDLLSRHIRKLGYEVVTASGGEVGLRMARTLQPALVTLDIAMPDADGWAVLQQLKADPATAGIPVVPCTINDEKARGIALGAADYLTKPVDATRLAEVLRNCVEGERPLSVLVVDDSATARQLIRRLLEKQRCTVAEAVDGQEALEALGREAPDLVLLDLEMPRVDGFEFLAAVRENPEWHDLRVVVMTARDIDAADRQRLNGRVEDVLQKSGGDAHGETQYFEQLLSSVLASNPHAPARSIDESRG